MNLHIHAPKPSSIHPLDYENYKDVPKDKLGRITIMCDRCFKLRVLHNLEMLCYEWYEPIIRCKAGKGCRKKARGD